MAEVKIMVSKEDEFFVVSGLPEIPGVAYTVSVSAGNSVGMCATPAAKVISTPAVLPSEAPGTPVIE